jgi:hypothetical protein
MKNKPQKTYVKIQGKWLQADNIHVYANGAVWYNLKGGQGAGWVDDKYKKKFRII